MRASNVMPRGLLALILPVAVLAWMPGCDSKPGAGEVHVGGAVVDPAVEAANAEATKNNADIIKKTDPAKKAK